MSPGKPDQETSHRQRLVPGGDGYADYAEESRSPGQHRYSKSRSARGQAEAAASHNGNGRGSDGRGSDGRGHGGSHVAGSARPTESFGAVASAPRRVSGASRQRSIRSTIAILLIIPLFSLVALYVYSAYSTAGNALARRSENTLNQDVGGPFANVAEALDVERTY